MDYKQPNLLASVFLFIVGAGIIYFIDIPLRDNAAALDNQIALLSARKKVQDEHTKIIAEIGQDISKSKWKEYKKKIDPNFSSSPFYVPKTEKFFGELIAKSGMELTTLNIALGSAGETKTETTTSKTVKPTEQPVATKAPVAGAVGISGITGPVKKNSVTIVAKGTYEQLKELLSIFERQAYLISIKSISFGAGGENNQFTFNINGEIYSY